MLELISNTHMTEEEFKTNLMLLGHKLNNHNHFSMRRDIKWYIEKEEIILFILITDKINTYHLKSKQWRPFTELHYPDKNIHCNGFEALLTEILLILKRAGYG